jgi:hypothetical protein
MAVGPTNFYANSLLNALLRATSFTGPAQLWLQLHTASPGAAGTTAVTNAGRRIAVDFNAAAGGIAVNTADVSFLNVANGFTATFYSLWTASAGGTFVGSGVMIAGPVSTGQDFTIPAGQLVASILTAA